ncbi:MAG: hypothetical protein IJL63_09355 [Clostridia bacterium]|nr:hypothetical protein [Clostridia bacterium]
MQLNEAYRLIISGIQDAIEQNGFSLANPVKGDEVPVTVDGERSYIDYKGEKGKIRLEFSGLQALLFYSESDSDESLEKASVNYFNAEEFDQRDIKSLCNELSETINAHFGYADTTAQKAKKKPVPVSKAAAKSGSQSYDGNTLANRLTGLYPQLKEPYKANYEKYGEFLAEEFFDDYGTKEILATIKSGNQQELKRLFKILNDIYENGSSDTQGIIAVTILGHMDNDEKMCRTAEEYMCDDMREIVLLINKYLASPKGQKMWDKMNNPPAYKPKKQKQPGLFSQMMAAGNAQNGGMPPM